MTGTLPRLRSVVRPDLNDGALVEEDDLVVLDDEGKERTRVVEEILGARILLDDTWPLSQVPLTSMTSAARATRREDDVVVGEDDMALESQLAWMLDLNDISQVTLEFGENVTGSALRWNSDHAVDGFLCRHHELPVMAISRLWLG